jgi:peroxiredoxin
VPRTAPAASRPPSTRSLVYRSRRRRQRLVGVAVASVVLVAVAVFAVQRATPAPDALTPASSDASASGPATVGRSFPEFRLATVDGAQVTPDKLRGSDAILWFTTTYCVPCQIGAAKYQSLAGELGDKAPTMVFVFLDPQEPDAALREFRSKYGLPQWAMAMDTDQLAQRAGVQVLDTKIFVDETGVVRDIDTAPVDDSYLADVRRLATGA